MIVYHRIVSISCGWYNSFAVDDTGKVWAFGLDNYGQSSAAKPSTQPKKLDEEEEVGNNFSQDTVDFIILATW